MLGNNTPSPQARAYSASRCFALSPRPPIALLLAGGGVSDDESPGESHGGPAADAEKQRRRDLAVRMGLTLLRSSCASACSSSPAADLSLQRSPAALVASLRGEVASAETVSAAAAAAVEVLTDRQLAALASRAATAAAAVLPCRSTSLAGGRPVTTAGGDAYDWWRSAAEAIDTLRRLLEEISLRRRHCSATAASVDTNRMVELEDSGGRDGEEEEWLDRWLAYAEALLVTLGGGGGGIVSNSPPAAAERSLRRSALRALGLLGSLPRQPESAQGLQGDEDSGDSEGTISGWQDSTRRGGSIAQRCAWILLSHIGWRRRPAASSLSGCDGIGAQQIGSATPNTGWQAVSGVEADASCLGVALESLCTCLLPAVSIKVAAQVESKARPPDGGGEATKLLAAAAEAVLGRLDHESWEVRDAAARLAGVLVSHQVTERSRSPAHGCTADYHSGDRGDGHWDAEIVHVLVRSVCRLAMTDIEGFVRAAALASLRVGFFTSGQLCIGDTETVVGVNGSTCSIGYGLGTKRSVDSDSTIAWPVAFVCWRGNAIHGASKPRQSENEDRDSLYRSSLHPSMVGSALGSGLRDGEALVRRAAVDLLAEFCWSNVPLPTLAELFTYTIDAANTTSPHDLPTALRQEVETDCRCVTTTSLVVSDLHVQASDAGVNLRTMLLNLCQDSDWEVRLRTVNFLGWLAVDDQQGYCQLFSRRWSCIHHGLFWSCNGDQVLEEALSGPDRPVRECAASFIVLLHNIWTQMKTSLEIRSDELEPAQIKKRLSFMNSLDVLQVHARRILKDVVQKTPEWDPTAPLMPWQLRMNGSSRMDDASSDDNFELEEGHLDCE